MCTEANYAEAGSLEARRHVQRRRRWKERNGIAPRADNEQQPDEDGGGRDERRWEGKANRTEREKNMNEDNYEKENGQGELIEDEMRERGRDWTIGEAEPFVRDKVQIWVRDA